MTMTKAQPRILSPEQLAEWTPAQRRYWGKRLPNSVPDLPAQPEAAPLPPVTAIRILAVCAEAGNISVDDLIADRRVKRVSSFRHVAAYLIRKHRELSLIDIGQRLGRDHSTVLASIRTVEKDLDNGGIRFAPIINDAEKRLGLLKSVTSACE